MTQPNKIEKAIDELFRRENDYDAAIRDAAEKDAAYRTAKAEAFLLADGTDKAREAKSVCDSKQSYLEKVRAEAVAAIMKEKLLDVRQVISARQSILSASVKVWDGSKNYTA